MNNNLKRVSLLLASVALLASCGVDAGRFSIPQTSSSSNEIKENSSSIEETKEDKSEDKSEEIKESESEASSIASSREPAGTDSSIEEDAYTQGLQFYALDDGNYAVAQGATSLLSEIKVPRVYDGHFVTKIKDSGFSSAKLKSISLPDTLVEIGASAFIHCDNLEGIEIPSSVTTIGEYAFAWCSKLNEINIPTTVKTVGECAFAYNTITTVLSNYYRQESTDKRLFYNSTVECFYCKEEFNYPYHMSLMDELFPSPVYFYREDIPTNKTISYWHYVKDVPTVYTTTRRPEVEEFNALQKDIYDHASPNYIYVGLNPQFYAEKFSYEPTLWIWGPGIDGSATLIYPSDNYEIIAGLNFLKLYRPDIISTGELGLLVKRYSSWDGQTTDLLIDLSDVEVKLPNGNAYVFWLDYHESMSGPYLGYTSFYEFVYV